MAGVDLVPGQTKLRFGQALQLVLGVVPSAGVREDVAAALVAAAAVIVVAAASVLGGGEIARVDIAGDAAHLDLAPAVGSGADTLHSLALGQGGHYISGGGAGIVTDVYAGGGIDRVPCLLNGDFGLLAAAGIAAVAGGSQIAGIDIAGEIACGDLGPVAGDSAGFYLGALGQRADNVAARLLAYVDVVIGIGNRAVAAVVVVVLCPVLGGGEVAVGDVANGAVRQLHPAPAGGGDSGALHRLAGGENVDDIAGLCAGVVTDIDGGGGIDRVVLVGDGGQLRGDCYGLRLVVIVSVVVSRRLGRLLGIGLIRLLGGGVAVTVAADDAGVGIVGIPVVIRCVGIRILGICGIVRIVLGVGVSLREDGGAVLPVLAAGGEVVGDGAVVVCVVGLYAVVTAEDHLDHKDEQGNDKKQHQSAGGNDRAVGSFLPLVLPLAPLRLFGRLLLRLLGVGGRLGIAGVNGVLSGLIDLLRRDGGHGSGVDGVIGGLALGGGLLFGSRLPTGSAPAGCAVPLGRLGGLSAAVLHGVDHEGGVVVKILCGRGGGLVLLHRGVDYGGDCGLNIRSREHSLPCGRSGSRGRRGLGSGSVWDVLHTGQGTAADGADGDDVGMLDTTDRTFFHSFYLHF